jgi:hypothetical protein
VRSAKKGDITQLAATNGGKSAGKETAELSCKKLKEVAEKVIAADRSV